MKLYFLCLSALTVGALCKIDDVCIVQSVKSSFFFTPSLGDVLGVLATAYGY